MSLEQLQCADLGFFKRFMKDTRPGIRLPSGVQALHSAVDNHKNSPSVMKHLQLLPKAAGARQWQGHPCKVKCRRCPGEQDEAPTRTLKGQLRNMKSKDGGKNSSACMPHLQLQKLLSGNVISLLEVAHKFVRRMRCGGCCGLWNVSRPWSKSSTFVH